MALSGLRCGYLVAGIVLLLAGIFFAVSEAVPTFFASFVNRNFFNEPLNFSLNWFLLIPTGILAISYFITAFWQDGNLETEVNRRARPWRWVFHGIYLPLYLVALGGIAIPVSLDGAAGIAGVLVLAALGVGLAYTHASNESQNASLEADEDAAARNPKTKRSNLDRRDHSWEGIITTTVIFVVLVVAFVFYTLVDGPPTAPRFAIPLIAGIWYLVLIVYQAIFVNGKVDIDENLRDGLLIVWEVVFAAYLHVAVFFFWV